MKSRRLFILAFLTSTQPSARRKTKCPPAKPAQEAAPAQAASSAPSAATSTIPQDTYNIGPSDVLAVTVWKEPTFSGSLLVRPDGMISIPLLGDIQASGLTPLQLADRIAIKLKKFVQDPNVSVEISQIHSKVVYLLGEVAKKGPVDMTPGMTLLEAVASAGGLTDFANTKKIYILRNEAGDHQTIAVHYKEALKGNAALNLALKPGDTIAWFPKPPTMKTTLKISAFLWAICSSAGAQVAPEATQGAAHMDYSLHYSQTAEFGGSLGTWQTAAASGLVDYANGSERLPLSLNFTGGYNFTFAGPGYSTGLFERLLISQGIYWRRWSIAITDNVSYRPQAPTTGFSGIPGIGEPIGTPSPTPPSGESILTVNTHVVDNMTNVDLHEKFDYATTVSAGGSSELRRFPDGNGLNVNTQSANAGLKRRLDARNSLTSDYSFAHSSYPDYGIAFTSNTLLLGFTRLWNPGRISTIISAGPQWIGSSDGTSIPSSTSYSIRAAADLQVSVSLSSAELQPRSQ